MKISEIVVLDNNSEFVDELKSVFGSMPEYEICGVSGNGNVGITLINECKPDVVVLNLVLSGTDGFGVMDYIGNNNLNCKVIVISNFPDEKIVNSAIAHGAKYYFVKPVNVRNIVDRIIDLTSEPVTESQPAPIVHEKRSVFSLDEKISNIFITIGIPPHIKGYQYLREGIKEVIEEPQLINHVTKQLYPNIANKFGTSASKVERAIRHAIEVAWNRGRFEAIAATFGARVYIGTEKPTNSEFIALVADKLIIEDLR